MLGLTRSSVAVLAHIPNATVLTSHFIASMTSRMAMVAYGDPPAVHTYVTLCACLYHTNTGLPLQQLSEALYGLAL